MRDEFEKIAWLTARFELAGSSDDLIVGIGDDAAVFDFGNRPTIVTVDAQVEGVHFRRPMLSPVELGARAMIAAASDVLAMAATPLGSVIALTLPEEYPDADFRGLIDGLADAARRTSARVIGGNLSGGPALSITTTVFGRAVAEPLTRRGARPGDALYVTGTLGAAALGFQILDTERTEIPAAARFIDRWRIPPVHVGLAAKLATVATAAVDISDGLLQDAGHLCRASGVGATVRAEALPALPGFVETCAELELDPLELSLAGGEDYEILFTAPSSDAARSIATEVGLVEEGSAVRVVDREGAELSTGSTGFRHFS
jgi:thiamine-monophosphate kinase